MTEKICYIIAAGEHFDDTFVPQKGDLVIAADAGYEQAKKMGIEPDILVGDFDSISAVPVHEHIVALNPVKDETDTFEALQIGLQKGYQKFILFGGTGGTLAHTIANIQNLAMLAKKGAQGFLVGKREMITVIHNDILYFDENAKGMISVFSLESESVDVTETGLKYPLSHYTMRSDHPIGVSNEFIGETSKISVRQGTLLVIYPKGVEAK